MTNPDFHRSAASEGLKACPFCGPGQSMVDPWFDDVSKRWAIGCGRCGASSGRSVHAEGSKEAAIKSWNTRGLTGDDAQACAVRLEARPADNSKEWTEIFPAQLEWVAKAGHQVRAIEVAAQPPAAPVETKWECMGRKQALPEPGECNWPDCGCDPHATKVIESLIEQGWQAPAHPGSSAGNVDEVAAHFLACDAGSDISWAKTRLREWKDAVHYGDCTKAPITCNRCCADEAHERAKALLSVMPDVPQGAGK